MTTNSLPMGILISGICEGHLHTSDNGFENDYILIKTGEYTDQNGQKQNRYERIDIFGHDLQAYIEKANKFKGNHVVISTLRRPAKRELSTARMRNIIHSQSSLLVLS